MGKGRAALSYLPAVGIKFVGGAGDHSVEAVKAALNKVAKLQEDEITSGVFNDEKCLTNQPYSEVRWDIDATAQAGVAADGTVTLASAQAGDTVTVNGLVYTAVAGAKSDNTEFSIDTSDTAAATDLADSITNDTRTGTKYDVTAESAAAVVTITATEVGSGGNDITLVSSNGTRLAVSGAGTLTGGVDQVDYELTFSSDTTDVVGGLGRAALSTRRLIDFILEPEAGPFTVRSAFAVVNFIEKLEDKVASTGSGAAGDGTYTDVVLKGFTPYENFTWTLTKSGNEYTATSTANS